MIKISFPLKVRGSFALLGASLTIALFGTLVHLLNPMFGTATQSVFRALLAALIMLAVMIALRHRPARLSRQDWYKIFIVGACGSITLILFTLVATQGKAATATLLVFAGAILTALLGGAVVFKEHLSFIRIAAICLVVAGLIAYANDFAYAGITTWLGISGGISDGVANLVRKRMRHIDRSTAVTYQYFIGSAIAAIYVLFSHEKPILQIHILPILIMVVFALLALSLGALLLYGYAHVDVQTGAILSAMQVFFALILGLLFLHQTPSVQELTGCLLIGAGSCLAVWDAEKATAAVQRLVLRRRRPEEEM